MHGGGELVLLLQPRELAGGYGAGPVEVGSLEVEERVECGKREAARVWTGRERRVEVERGSGGEGSGAERSRAAVAGGERRTGGSEARAVSVLDSTIILVFVSVAAPLLFLCVWKKG